MLRRIIAIIAVALTLPAMSWAQGYSAPELRQNWQEIADLISSTGRDDSAARILESVNALSDEELEHVYGQVDFGSMINALMDIEKAVDAVDRLGGGISVRELGDGMTMPDRNLTEPVATSVGFPTINYPASSICPLSPGRSNGEALQIAVDIIQGARVALEVAKGIWSGLSRGCDQTVVVLGEGGNTSLACIPADATLAAAELVVGSAEGVVEHLEACDNGVDSAEIEGTWKGAVHTHADLADHTNQLTAHDTNLVTHDGDIKAKLDQQKGMLESVLANQQEILANQQEIFKLLKTPEGRRPGWNVEGY